MNQLDFNALFWGLAVSIGLSFVIGVVLAVATGIGIAADETAHTPEMSDEEFARYYLENISETRFMFALVLASLLVNALGGYIAAWLSREGPYLNAGLTGALALAFSLTMEARQPVLPRWAVWMWALGAVPAALFGGWIAAG